jgi:hypothetical protein
LDRIVRLRLDEPFHIGRLTLLKVMHQNDIDVFVHPENTVPTPKIQGPTAASEPRRDDAVPSDPENRRPGGLHAGGLRAAVRIEPSQDRFRLSIGTGHETVAAAAPDADCDHGSRLSPARATSRR